MSLELMMAIAFGGSSVINLLRFLMNKSAGKGL
jgi:hypothetical protein